MCLNDKTSYSGTQLPLCWSLYSRIQLYSMVSAQKAYSSTIIIRCHCADWDTLSTRQTLIQQISRKLITLISSFWLIVWGLLSMRMHLASIRHQYSIKNRGTHVWLRSEFAVTSVEHSGHVSERLNRFNWVSTRLSIW